MISGKIKTVCTYVIPSIFAGLSLCICTMADGIIAGRFVGTDALGAVSIALPPAILVNSIYVLIISGGSACAAVMFGSGDDASANKIFMHALILSMAAGVLFTLAGTLFSTRICALLGAGDTFLKLSSEYLFWIAMFAIPIGLSPTLSNFVRNDGSPILCSVGIITSAVGNVFLDLLFIRLLGWGTAGAAAATGISQVIAAAIIFTHFLRGDGKRRLHVPEFDKKVLGEIIYRGVPDSIGQFGGPIRLMCLNMVLVRQIGDIGVNAFSVISYILTFVSAIFYGTGNGLQPLFGRSYGSKNSEDLHFYLKSGFLLNVMGSIAVLFILIVFSQKIGLIFGTDAATLDYIVTVLPKYAWAIVPMSIEITIYVYFYATKRTAYAIYIILLLFFILEIPSIIILPRIFGPEIIWYTYGISEIIVAIAALGLLRHSELKMNALK